MGNRDLEQAIAYALEPLTQQGMMELCTDCGVVKYQFDEYHQCDRMAQGMPGAEPTEEKKRAKSYCVE